jgi:2-dehydro-3-deoxyphosphogluconate aldolase/(4S)-4-hydroxy-2-oxoglutarate aldolase
VGDIKMTQKILEEIHEKGIVAIVRARNGEEGLKLANAIFEAGIPAVEITMTVPNAIDIMKDLAKEYAHKGLILGAGTVLDPETARQCILAGAEYIVAPNLNEDLIRLCNRYSMPCMPGVGTVTELVRAMELGIDVVKLFPGEVLGPDFIKAVLGPIPYAKMMPTGGVNIDNLDKWFKAGAYAVGMGSGITKPNGVEGDYEAVRRTAKDVVENIAKIRKDIK